MKGNVYTDEKCPVCGGKLNHSGDRDGFLCINGHGPFIPKKMRVKFGRDVSKRFAKYGAARQFLEGLRFKTVEGTFDERDYRKDHPLGFRTQFEKFLKIKARDASAKHVKKNIEPVFNRAVAVWNQKNVKTIGYSEIEDFINDLELSDKTRHNYCSVLHNFFKWLSKREKVPIPEFPIVSFTLGWRNIVNVETQSAIIDEVKRISWDRTPKVWVGIKWLATYVSIRPNELRNLKERHIDINGCFVIPDPKEKMPKIITMLPEDIELYHSFPRALPEMYFFRHDKPHGQTKAGEQFAARHLYKWWKKACSNLKIEGVDLYGGTRHSTTTALANHFSEDQLMNEGTCHKTNKAFRRYMQSRPNAMSIYATAKIKKEVAGIVR